MRRRNLRNYSIFDASAVMRIGEASKRDIFIVIFMLRNNEELLIKELIFYTFYEILFCNKITYVASD